MSKKKQFVTGNKKSFKVGIVGCGRIAEHHLKFLTRFDNLDIIGLVDKNIEQAIGLGEKYNISRSLSSIDELLESNDIDVVHILTPPEYHFEQAKKAIENGTHILIEKPLTLSFDETQKLYSMAEERDVKICPDFINLYNPLVLDAKAAIKENDFGRVISAEYYMSMNLNTAEDNEAVGLHWSYYLPGGILYNNITHPLYMIIDWIGKSKKVTILPRSYGSLSQSVTDHMDILIEGATANGKISITVAPRHENNYLKLFFENATITIDFVTQTLSMEKVSSIPRSLNRVMINFIRSYQLMGGSVTNIINYYRKKMLPYQGLKHLLDSFYGWIEGNNTPPVSKELAVEVSFIEEKIQQNAGKVHFDANPRPSVQKNISKKEKIFVTGGTGYLGREVVKQLVEAGYHVKALARISSHTDTLEKLGVELIYGDVREVEVMRDAVQGMDIIIHIAAMLKGSKSYMFDSNVNGTRNIAEAARQANVKRVIYISSFSVYDYTLVKNGEVLNEGSMLETQGEKRGVSSWVKCQAEDIALSNLSDDGPAWTILRPSLIFGNGREFMSLIGPRVGKYVISFGTKNKHLKLIHIEDIAEAILFAIQKDKTCNRVYNISHEDQITVNEIVDNCFQRNELKKYHVVYIPYSLGIMGIAMMRCLKVFLKRGPSMNRVRLAYLCKDLLANSMVFREATGWQTRNELMGQLMREAEKLK